VIYYTSNYNFKSWSILRGLKKDMSLPFSITPREK